ncbi:MAG: NAD(P)-dependent oxidoreductase [Patescibacteria group bacterium]|nr:NAD(P)-dependent oxidoreductase [Patescibacteria group bacterium]
MNSLDSSKKVNIAITGAKGTIGSILQEGLTDFDITPLDLPDVDVGNLDQMVKVLAGQSAVIHLAWNYGAEDLSSGQINPDNYLMTCSVYESARRAKVKRVIMASSVHAHRYSNLKEGELLSTDQVPLPDSLYGASKVFVEALGRYYAKNGLEVICLRFGRVRKNDDPGIDEPQERIVWLSKSDARGLIRKCLTIKEVPNSFALVNAVSDNTDRVHDVSNPFGWVPRDNYKNTFR